MDDRAEIVAFTPASLAGPRHWAGSWSHWELVGVVAAGVAPPFLYGMSPLVSNAQWWLVEGLAALCVLLAGLAYLRRGGLIGWLGLAGFLALHALICTIRFGHLHAAVHLLGNLSNLAVILSVLVFVSRPPARWAEHGLVRPRWLVDILLGLGLYAAYRAIWLGLVWAVHLSGLSLPAAARLAWIEAPLNWSATLVFAATNALAEELVMRAYLIPRLERLTRSTTASVCITALLFAAWHFDQGPFGLVFHVLNGLILGATFCWTRRLAPVALGHTLMDLHV